MEASKLGDIVALFPGKQILVVGDVMLDEYIWGDVRRVSPEAPVPVVEIRCHTYLPGGAANTAANVVSLGGEALLGAVIGQDDHANQLCRVLEHYGMDVAGLVVDKERSTTTKTRVVAHRQQIVRVDLERRTPLPIELENALLAWVERKLNEADACVLSDYAKGVISNRLAQTCIQMAHKSGKPIVVDPKGTDYTKYRGATIITPNIQETEKALGSEIRLDTDLQAAGRRLSELLGGCAVLVTQGARGMTLFLQGSQAIHIPAVARSVYDVTGAGDTVVGTLALALATGASLVLAASLANRAAGLVIEKVGTATVTREELLAGIE